jgi:RHS repeat-associated protein
VKHLFGWTAQTSTDQGGRATITEADELGRLVRSTDVRGFVTTYVYDLVGNRLSQTGADGAVTTWTYDNENRVVTTTDPRGNVPGANPALFTTTYTYDIEGDQTAMTDPLGRVTTMTYDNGGRLDTTTEPGGRATNLGYDPSGRLKQATQTGLGTTRYTYDTSGNLRTRIDQKTRVTTYDFDLANRLIKQTDPAQPFVTYTYDIAGRQKSTTDAVANAAANAALGTTSMTYDQLSRPTKTTYSDGTPEVSYTYDTQGRRAAMIDGTGTTTYTYDGLNRVKTKAIPNGPTLTYEYDRDNNVTAVSDGTAGSTRTFDEVGRLVTVTDSTGQKTTYTYDKAGFLVGIEHPGGVKQTRTYDGAGQLVTIVDTNNQGTIRSYTYSRDTAGNPLKIETAGPSGVLPSESELFTYDTSYRLRKACWSNTACATTNQTAWTYDTVGNRLTEKIGPNPVSTYAYDGVDQLASVTTGTNVQTFGYNANGDQTKAGDMISTFNAAHQTKTVQTPQGAVAYSYDGSGNRIRSSATAAGGVTSVTNFNWDTITSAIPNVSTETDASGGVKRRYTFGADLISMQTPTAKSWALADPLGTITHLTSATGAVQAEYTTSPWGVANKTQINDPAVATNPIRFTGQYADPVSGLVHLRARQYNPTLGSFTQQDPLQARVGSAYPSTYVYANNNPNMYSDRTGLRSKCGDGSFLREVGCATIDTVKGLGEFAKEGVQVVRHPVDSAQKAWEGAKAACQHYYDSGVRYQDALCIVGVAATATGVDGMAHRAVDCIQAPGAVTQSEFNCMAAKAVVEVETTYAIGKAIEKLPGGEKMSPGCLPASFREDTPVVMADRTRKKIADVKVGDQVLATDPLTGKTTFRTVTATLTHDDNDLLDLVVKTDTGTETIHTTDHHRIWNETKHSWVLAIDLKSGNELRSENGQHAYVSRLIHIPGHRSMLDLTVEIDHTFYVDLGTGAILVHNARKPVNFPNTSTPNSVIDRRSPSGDVTAYARYDADGIIIERVDIVGASHGGIATPHVTPYNHYVDENGVLHVNSMADGTYPAVPGVDC